MDRIILTKSEGKLIELDTEGSWTMPEIMDYAFSFLLGMIKAMDEKNIIPASENARIINEQIKKAIEEGEKNEQVPQQKDRV